MTYVQESLYLGFPTSKDIHELRFVTGTDPWSIMITIFQIVLWLESDKIDHRTTRNGVGYYILKKQSSDRE